MNGKSPQSGAPICWKTCGSAFEDEVEQHQQHRRDDEQQRDRARVVPDLPAGRAAPSRPSTRALTAPPPSRSRRGRPRRGPARRSPRAVRPASSWRSSRPSRISSSSSHSRASSITWLETSSVVPARASVVEGAPQLGPQDGVEADGRLVEHQHLGLAEQRRRRARRASAGRRRASRPGAARAPPRPTVSITAAIALAVRPTTAREVAQVLLDAEVGVDRGRLGDVADPAAQRRRAGRLAEHRDAAAGDDLDADDRPHQRRLAAAARPEQAGHRSRGATRARAAQHLAAAALDLQAR